MGPCRHARPLRASPTLRLSPEPLSRALPARARSCRGAQDSSDVQGQEPAKDGESDSRARSADSRSKTGGEVVVVVVVVEVNSVLAVAEDATEVLVVLNVGPLFVVPSGGGEEGASVEALPSDPLSCGKCPCIDLPSALEALWRERTTGEFDLGLSWLHGASFF